MSLQRPIFLHFLNRELLRSLTIDRNIDFTWAITPIRILLLSGAYPLYASASFILENPSLAENECPIIFESIRRNHLILTSDSPTIAEHIDRRRRIYQSDGARYPIYFGPTKGLLKLPVGYNKQASATSSLAHSLTATEDSCDQICARFQMIPHDSEIIMQHSTKIATRVKNRDGRGVTLSLFDNPRFQPQSRLPIARLLSTLYIEHNTQELQADICTGIQDLGYYDNMCLSFPFSDVPTLSRICIAAGLENFFLDPRTVRTDELLSFRENRLQSEFCEAVERIISVISIHSGGESMPFRRREMLRSLDQMIARFEIRDATGRKEKFTNDIAISNLCRLEKIYLKIHRKALPLFINTTTNRTENMTMQNDEVFVIHGRNEEINRAMFDFLRSLNLKPIEWSQAVAKTRQGSPNISDVLDAVISNKHTIVALFTDDETVALRKELAANAGETKPGRQPRANVLFEVGLAYGRCPERTIIVECGILRPISDLLGRNVVRINDSPERRQDLVTRLRAVGCPVNQDGNHWLTAGKFMTL